VVNRVITDLAVIDVLPEGLKLIECAAGVSPDTVQSKTAATLIF
jgi:3-oxoacid CoA-transferase subunit B